MSESKDKIEDIGYLKFKNELDVSSLETQEVLRVDDKDGREYMYDGTELYRLMPLKGRFGRVKSKSKN